MSTIYMGTDMSIAFYMGITLLLLLSVIFALWPLINSIVFERRSLGLAGWSVDNVERQAMNVALYRDHVAELERSLAQLTINQSQFDALKAELEHNLLEDSQVGRQIETVSQIADAVQSPQDKPAKNGLLQNTGQLIYSWVYTFSAIALLAFGGIFMYQMLGNHDGWQLQSQLALQARLEHEFARTGADNDVLAKELGVLSHQLVTDIDRYSARFPENLDTKVLLARTAMRVGRYDKAIEAYQSILTQQPDAAQLLAEMAQAIFLKANNQAIPLVVTLAERALSIEPRTAMALSLLGIANFQGQRYNEAIQYWRQAIRFYPPRSPSIRVFQQGIAQAQAHLSASGSTTSISSPEASASSGNPLSDNPLPDNPPSDNPPSDNPSFDNTASNKVAVDQAQTQTSELTLAVSAADNIPLKPDDTVFVYARAWQGAKLPLAIARLNASQLPITLTLDDTMSMARGMNLSSVKQVEVIARLSPSGSAKPQAGDWQVSIGPISTQKSLSAQKSPPSVYPLVISQPVK